MVDMWKSIATWNAEIQKEKKDIGSLENMVASLKGIANKIKYKKKRPQS